MLKKIFLSLLITCLTSTLFSQEIIQKSFSSKEFQGKRNYKIYLPKEYKKDTILNYPVTIVLDDDYLFDLYVGNAKLYADVDLAPRQIVVGVKTDQRANKDVSLLEQNEGLTTNSSHFFNFVKFELLPYVQKNFKASAFTTIVGEGNAANFLTHYIKEPKPAFNSFICLNPSFTDLTLERIKSYGLNRFDNIDNTFFFNIAYNNHAKEEKINLNKNIYEHAESSSKKLEKQLIFIEGASNRLSSISAGIPRTITHTFKYHPKISKEEYDTKIKDLEPLEAIKYLEDRYIESQYLYGTNVNIRMDDIFSIEGIVIDKLNGDYLRVLGDLVMRKHPDSHIGDYYIGLFHEKGKDYEKALFYYKEAYGKMDSSDPNMDEFYENIKRVNKLLVVTLKEKEEANPSDEESLPIEDEEELDDEKNKKNNEDQEEEEEE